MVHQLVVHQVLLTLILHLFLFVTEINMGTNGRVVRSFSRANEIFLVALILLHVHLLFLVLVPLLSLVQTLSLLLSHGNPLVLWDSHVLRCNHLLRCSNYRLVQIHQLR